MGRGEVTEHKVFQESKMLPTDMPIPIDKVPGRVLNTLEYDQGIIHQIVTVGKYDRIKVNWKNTKLVAIVMIYRNCCILKFFYTQIFSKSIVNCF